MKRRFLVLIIALSIIGIIVTTYIVTYIVRETVIASNSLTLTNEVARQALQQSSAAVELEFNFTRQSGHASNQYAVWIEDAQGQYVKTLYATLWTARGGWSRRSTSIPVWVRQSGLSDMTRSEINALSGATPATGIVTYVWDGTNSHGVTVPDGNYMLLLEGTLRWENQVFYSIPFSLGQGSSALEFNVQYSGDSTAERTMISDVKARVLR